MAWSAFGALKAITVLTVILGAGVAVNVAQLLTFPTWLISRRLFRTLNIRLGCIMLKCGPFLLEKWGSCGFSTHGEQPPKSASVLVLVNHNSDLDWAAGLSLFNRIGPPLPGCAKAVVKNSLKYIPVYGWMFYFLEYFFLQRRWDKDKAGIEAQADTLRDYPKPFWVALFPEGTRKTPSKLKQSQEFCRKRGHPVLYESLFPRFKAFTQLVHNMRDTLDGVLDATLVYDRGIPKLDKAMQRTCFTHVCVETRWFPMSSLPRDTEALEQWLTQRWVDKEATIRDARERGVAAHFASVPPWQFAEDPPRYRAFYAAFALNVLMWIGVGIAMARSAVLRRAVLLMALVFLVGCAAAMVYVIKPSAFGEGIAPPPGPEANVAATAGAVAPPSSHTKTK